MPHLQPARRTRRLAALLVAVPAGCQTGGSPMASLHSRSGASTVNLKVLQQKMEQVRSVYHRGFAFPKWVVDDYAKGEFFEVDAKRCKIFYDDGNDREDVLYLATRREPVNIGMSRAYDPLKLKDHFEYEHGAYSELAKDGRLPPNFAIMCPTPVVSGVGQPDDPLNENQLSSVKNIDDRVHILNVIGYAFDSEHQPDQKYFLSGGYDLTPDKKNDLIERMERIFDKIFAAALEYELDTIVLARFGAGAFAANYPGGLIYEDVWIPACVASLNAWATKLKGQVTQVSIMGGPSQSDGPLQDAVQQLGFTWEVYTFFPEPLRTQLGKKLKKALVVNAWDCWSLIGNGNFRDNSLDGFIGRTTALAVLGWPMTNPYLQDNMIPVKSPKK